MRINFTLTIAAALIGAAPALAGQPCLPYDKPVTLSGFVVRGVLPGPPDYSDIRSGDYKSSLNFLLLEQPICTQASKGDPEMATPGHGMLEILQIGWLAFPTTAELAALEGRRATFNGTLVGAATGHHRTQVLLMDARPTH